MTISQSEKMQLFRNLGFESCYLAACALRNTVPQLEEELDLEQLYRFCKFHSITAIVAMALESVWKEQPAEPEIMTKWRQARDKAIRKNILLNAERERILAHLEAMGCWYMPLKGSLLQYDYPVFGMRQMSDNDILFDERYQEQVYGFMTADGYEAVHYRQGNHDEYVKKPVYNIEMHKGLFMSSISPELSRYYSDVRRLMRKDADNSFGYHMSQNDSYVYLVAHAYKHYTNSGIGIRNLLDVYVYVSKHEKELDWPYITGELKKMGAGDFEEECRQLGRKLLETPSRTPALTQEENNVLDIYFSSGTFGTGQQTVDKKLEGARGGLLGKLRYFMKRLFPSVEYMIEMEPDLAQKRWMIPFAYIRRLLRGIFLRQEDIRREINRVKKSGCEDEN